MAGSTKTFRPPFWGTIGLVVSGGICVTAGFWQIDRATQKRELMETYAAGGGQLPLNELVDDELSDQFRYRKFSVRGRYDGMHQVLLDNMVYQGQIGYQVLTPLRIGAAAVMVNRGWVSANSDRSVMPDISIDDKVRVVTGRLNYLPRPGIRLDGGDPEPGSDWPRRLLFPTAEQLMGQVGYRVFDYQLMLDPDNDEGFLRDWTPDWMPAEKHAGYAVQWFALAFTLIVIYFFVNWKTPVAGNADG